MEIRRAEELGFEVEAVSVTKLQGQSYDGYAIKRKGGNVAPTIAKDVFERMSEEEFMELTELSFRFDTGSLDNYEQVKDKLTLQLIPVAGNEQRLAEVPHKQVEDMALVYRIEIPINDEQSGSILITNQLLDTYKVDENQLYDDAMEFVPKNNPATFRNMNEVMAEIMKVSVEDAIEMCGKSPLWVASVRGGQNGACVIQYPGFLEEAAKKLEGNFYVLPSSIHEVLLVKNDGCMKLKDLEDMVRSINQTEVAPADRLSDHVYYYDAADKKLYTV